MSSELENAQRAYIQNREKLIDCYILQVGNLEETVKIQQKIIQAQDKVIGIFRANELTKELVDMANQSSMQK